ncbi:40S ribosomal protein S7 [Camelus dromedarius]|uniref:40S ribosomal protein S7 n=1 Tax=Camelus dromedarius TaxID=9838 RepID=A0A5N4D7R6_CAMDR|nr:40S ribosomal protein S7 [Camelus dromedarius]
MHGRGHVQLQREDREAQWREPDEFESGISQVRRAGRPGGVSLRVSWGPPGVGDELGPQAQLRELNITAAKEIEVGGGRKAIIIFVPVPQLKSFQKTGPAGARVGEEVQREARRVHRSEENLPKPTRKSRTKNKQKRRSRTLTAVHDAILEDLVFPSEIVETFSGVYKKLSGKDVNLNFQSFSCKQK